MVKNARYDSYTERILISTLGMTPQVVTESVYALATRKKDNFIPSKIFIIGTKVSVDNFRKAIGNTNDEIYQIKLLCEDLQIPVPEIIIEEVRDESNVDVLDINDTQVSALFADRLLALVRKVTSNPNSALALSLAGGRKIMSFYAGHILSIYGREQDFLCHVLVDPKLENDPTFFFPLKRHNQTRNSSQPVDKEIILVDVPYVRLSHIIGKQNYGSLSFEKLVRKINNEQDKRIVINIKEDQILVSGVKIHFPPVQKLFFLYFINSLYKDISELDGPRGRRDKNWSMNILKYYEELSKSGWDIELRPSTLKQLNEGLEPQYFRVIISKINRRLKEALGIDATQYLIQSVGKPPRKYKVSCPRSLIEIRLT
jgi:CRISPR-associated protein (TIGR02584 family)